MARLRCNTGERDSSEKVFIQRFEMGISRPANYRPLGEEARFDFQYICSVARLGVVGSGMGVLRPGDVAPISRELGLPRRLPSIPTRLGARCIEAPAAPGARIETKALDRCRWRGYFG